MANRLTRRVRTAVLAAAALARTVVAVPTVAAAPPQCPTSRTDASTRCRSSSAHSRSRTPSWSSSTTRRAVDVAAPSKAAARRAQAGVPRPQRRLTQRVAVLSAQRFSAKYEGGSFSTTGALLTSDSGASYLDQLDTLSMISQHNAQLVQRGHRRSRSRPRRAGDTRDDAARATPRSQREALPSSATPCRRRSTSTRPCSPRYRRAAGRVLRAQQPDASRAGADHREDCKLAVKATPAAARKAVEFALAQVGKPYVWGAAGPSSYDCSGLTMAS